MNRNLIFDIVSYCEYKKRFIDRLSCTASFDLNLLQMEGIGTGVSVKMDFYTGGVEMPYSSSEVRPNCISGNRSRWNQLPPPPAQQPDDQAQKPAAETVTEKDKKNPEVVSGS